MSPGNTTHPSAPPSHWAPCKHSQAHAWVTARTALAWATPDNGVVSGWQHEADGHHAQVVIQPHRRPPRATLVDLAPAQPKHTRDTGTANVHIQQTNL